MMSHVDEGALHAYLDGALDEYPTAEAQRVREHLDVCATCRERLESERRVRDEAASVLGLAAPEVEVPSFEELRAYVRASAQRRSAASVRLHRLGWAASVVLALGTGWLLGGGDVVPVVSPDGALVAPPGAEEPAAPADEAAPASALAELSADAVDGEPAPTGGRESIAEQAPVQEEDTPVAAATVARAETPAAVAGGGVLDEVGRELPAGARARVAQVAPAPTTPDVTALADVVAVDDSAAGAAPAEPERPVSPADVVTSADRVAVAPPTALAPVDFDDARDDTTFERPAEASLVVPDLEVLEVRFRGDRRPEGQVVLQRLASGDTLEIIHLPPEIDPASLAPAEPGDLELVLQMPTRWIIMRAPVEELVLLELMERLLAER